MLLRKPMVYFPTDFLYLRRKQGKIFSHQGSGKQFVSGGAWEDGYMTITYTAEILLFSGLHVSLSQGDCERVTDMEKT